MQFLDVKANMPWFGPGQGSGKDIAYTPSSKVKTQVDVDVQQVGGAYHAFLASYDLHRTWKQPEKTNGGRRYCRRGYFWTRLILPSVRCSVQVCSYRCGHWRGHACGQTDGRRSRGHNTFSFAYMRKCMKSKAAASHLVVPQQAWWPFLPSLRSWSQFGWWGLAQEQFF